MAAKFVIPIAKFPCSESTSKGLALQMVVAVMNPHTNCFICECMEEEASSPHKLVELFLMISQEAGPDSLPQL